MYASFEYFEKTYIFTIHLNIYWTIRFLTKYRQNNENVVISFKLC